MQSGPLKGNFSIERAAPYDVTDGVVLDDGSFLLLERKFGLQSGIGMRIRRFKLDDIKPGALAKGDVVMEGVFPAQIDNMEGIDAYKADDGSTRLIVISDDNHKPARTQSDAGIQADAVRRGLAISLQLRNSGCRNAGKGLRCGRRRFGRLRLRTCAQARVYHSVTLRC